ncbi:MAG: ABC transporter permease subunit, partial [Bryobacteraceae bacterium]
GSFISIWAAADTVSREMKSGTILAVMARPVRRWEYLLGKYLGVQMLMVLYVALMLILSYVLAAIAGETIFSSPLVLIVYPLVRYAVYSAMSLLLVTWLHPFVAMGITIVIGILAHAATGQGLQFLPEWMRAPLAYVLPSTNLLSEVRFLTLTRTSLKPAPIADHLTALAYGLDYAAILFLLAAWAFRKRRVTGD